MPVVALCTNCQAELGHEEICPSCFYPTDIQETLFTLDLPGGPVVPTTPLTSPQEACPDLTTITFNPTSSLGRILIRIRGVVASLLVTMFFLTAGVYYYVDHQRNSAARANLEAQKAFQKGEFQFAQEKWTESFQIQKLVFDKFAQAEALKNVSRCHLRTEKFDLAIKELQRAYALFPSPDIADRIAKCYRLKAVRALAECKEAAKGKFRKEALAQATLAVTSFSKGKGSNLQMAEAQRAVALCHANLKDFEQAETLIDAAVRTEGNSKENRQVATLIKQKKAANLKSLKEASRRNKIAKQKMRNSYRPNTHNLAAHRKKTRSYNQPNYNYPKYVPPEEPDLVTTIPSYSTNHNSYGVSQNPSYSAPRIPNPYGNTGGYQRPNPYNNPRMPSIPSPGRSNYSPPSQRFDNGGRRY